MPLTNVETIMLCGIVASTLTSTISIICAFVIGRRVDMGLRKAETKKQIIKAIAELDILMCEAHFALEIYNQAPTLENQIAYKMARSKSDFSFALINASITAIQYVVSSSEMKKIAALQKEINSSVAEGAEQEEKLKNIRNNLQILAKSFL